MINISNVKTKEEFLENIKNEKIKNIFKNSMDTFELESRLYKFYLENLYQKIKGKVKH